MNILRQILGGLSAVLVFEFFTQVRKFFQVAYVPIYFQFLPLEVLNSDLSVYVGDDYFMGPGAGPKPSPAEAARLKARIQRRGILAVTVSALVIPAVAAFGTAQYVARDSLWPTLLGILVLYVYRARLSIQGFKHHASVADRPTVARLALLYITYTLVVLWVFRSVFIWTRGYVEAGKYSDMFESLAELFVGKIIVSGVVVAALAAIFLKELTDRHYPTVEAENDKR